MTFNKTPKEKHQHDLTVAYKKEPPTRRGAERWLKLQKCKTCTFKVAVDIVHEQPPKELMIGEVV